MDTQPIVKDFMQTDLITFKATDNINHVVGILLEHNISGAPVVDHENKLVGIISVKDCLHSAIESLYYDHPCGGIEKYMSTTVKTVFEDVPLFDVASEFCHVPYHRFAVVNEYRELVGLVTRMDTLRELKKICDKMRTSH